MSRCFPFPPPGYEKRARIDDTDLLTKEKQKEKKHKKDKKDKEKREVKEKKNKERSKDKHKEKKDRKEKKDKDRDKDKTQASAEKQPECHNDEIKDSKYVEELARRINDEDRAIGSQMVQNSVMDQRRAMLPEKMVEINNGKLVKEGEKIKDEKKINGFRNHIDPRILENERNSFGMDQARVDGKAKSADQNNVEKKMEAKEKNKQNGGDSKGEKHKDRDKEKRSKSKDKDRKREKEKKEKVKKAEQIKEQPKSKGGDKNMASSCIAKPSNHLNLGVLEEVEMKKEPTKEQPRLKANISLSPGTCVVKSLNLLKEGTKSYSGEGVLGKCKELEVKKEPISKDTSKDVPVISNIKLLNHVKEGIKSSNGEGILGKRKELEVKKEPISKDTSKDVPVISNIKLLNHVKEGIKSSNGEGILGKRKEPEMNGILNDNGTGPHKSQRLGSSLHPVVENGRKVEPTQIAEQAELERQGATSNHRVEIKKQRINGLVDAQPPNASSKRPSQATATLQVNENGRPNGLVDAQEPKVSSERPSQATAILQVNENGRTNGLVDAQEPKVSSKRPSHSTTTLQVNENGELCGKAPHPDSKYLNQILSIPKVEELSVLDDQEWLFGSNNPKSKKPKIGSLEDGTSQVWAKALQIESADIYALPYVIPY